MTKIANYYCYVFLFIKKIVADKMNIPANGTGFGGQLILLLTQQSGETIKEENDNGTHIFFEFKPARDA